MTRSRKRQSVDDLIDQWEPALRQAFLESVYNIRDAAQLRYIQDAVARGDVDAVLESLKLNPASFRPLDRALTAAFEAGGESVTGALPSVERPDGLSVEFQFDVRNPAAETWLREHSSRSVSEILEDQRTLVREHLAAGMAAGNNPREVTIDLVGQVGASGRREGGVIGLTSSQAEWVRNYEDKLRSGTPTDALSYSLRDARLDAAVRRAEETGQPIPEDLLEKMVNSYENRALRWRAESIGRTEAMAALHEAQSQSLKQAIESGDLSREAVTKIWRATHDKRTRDSHAVMDEQEVAMDEMFVTGAGNLLEYPGDPNGEPEERIGCRCWMETRVDFLVGTE